MDEPVIESAAFPKLLRIVAVVLMLGLVAGALSIYTKLRQAHWSTGSLVLVIAACACIAWFGYWLLKSRTRLEGSVLTQTWLWTKRARAQDVAHFKLVHLRALDAIVAPRLLVKQRNGGLQWFQAADGRVLQAFCDRVVQQRITATSSG
jgi:hypothetical protein